MSACIAEPGFNPGTFGLWAQHASHCATPLSEKILRSLFQIFVLVWCGSEKLPRQLQSAVPAFFSGRMVCKFTELSRRTARFAERPSIRWLQEIFILETDEEYRVVLVIKSTETGTIFQATDDSRGSNQSLHVQWAHDEANLLRSGESNCSPRIGLFFLGSLFLCWELMEAFPSPSTEETHPSLSK